MRRATALSVDEAAGAAARTSSLMTVPSGPVPLTVLKSIPCSFARRRALGETRARVWGKGVRPLAAAGDEGSDPFAPDTDSVILRAEGVDVGTSAGGFSPGATIQAIVTPTGMTSPSCDLTPARIPSAVASTSTTALSVLISRRGSPLLMASPSFLSHEMIFPVSCAISSAGITTLVAISPKHLPGRFEDHLLGGNRRIFQRRREGNRNVHRTDTFHRRIEIEETFFRDHRRDLGGYAVSLVTFVDDECTRRFLHGFEDRRLIKGPHRARIDDLRADTLTFQHRRGAQRHLHHTAGRNDSDIGALALYIGHTQRDRVILLRYRTFQPVHHFVFEEDDGIFVADGGLHEPLRIVWRRGQHDLQSGDMAEPRVQRL